MTGSGVYYLKPNLAPPASSYQSYHLGERRTLDIQSIIFNHLKVDATRRFTYIHQ